MSTLEWVVSVGGGLIAPFLLVTLIGCCLPRCHTAARSVVLMQAVQSIWESITTFERIPGWWPACVMVERLPDRDGQAVYRQTFLQGRRQQAMTIQVVESIAPTRFATKIADERGPFQGRWVYDLTRDGNGCKVTLTEHGEIKNPFIRTMYRLTMSKTQFIDSYLVSLGRKFGEQVTPA